MTNFARASAFALLMLPATFACSDNNATEPNPNQITVAAQTPSTTIAPGSSSSVAITVLRPESYDGPVTLTAENLPAGVTGTFAPATLSADESSSMLTLTVDMGTPTGRNDIIVRASGTDVASQTATISLAVGEGANTGSFTISVSPGAFQVAKGGSITALVAIERQGAFTGQVELSISGFPNGVFATITPASVSANIGTLNLSVDNTVASGTYSATIAAQGAGVAPQSIPISLTVLTALRR